MNILALDPATYCGWAHTCGLSGTWDLSVKRDESTGMRLIRLRAKLDGLKKDHEVQLLVFEAARKHGPNAHAALCVQSEIQGVIKLWCHDNAVEYRGYSSTEIKKHATGSGAASKEKMIDYAERRWKRVFEDDNEVDALWILDKAKKDYLTDASENIHREISEA